MIPTSLPILVVEDNPTTRKMFRVTLEAEGYRVLEAGDGRSALAHLAREVPALVLQDLVLPDQDGFDLARAIRAVPACADLPIVVMSGFPRLLARARNEPGCFDASLVKPVVPSLLIDVVRRYLTEPPSSTDGFGRGKTILIVDDDPVQLKLARLRFTGVGFAAVTASSGLEAVAIGSARPPDVIVCDVLMPGTDGYELCVAFRKTPALAAVPIVLVSAHYGGSGDEALARAAGASALVTRSPTLSETIEAVRRCLGDERAIPAQDPEFARNHADRVIAQLKRQARATAEIVERSALHAAQMSVLAGIADALARSSNLDEALEDVLAACLDAAGISRGGLFRTDAHGRIALSIASGYPDAPARELAGMFGYGQLLEPADHGDIVTPQDALGAADAATFLERAGVDAAVLVPIMDGRFRAGVLFLGTSVPDLVAHDLAVFGRAIAAHIAQALALTTAFGRLKDSAEASRVLSSSLDVGATKAAIGRLATAHLAQLCEIRIGDDAPIVYADPALPDDLAAVLAELGRCHPGRPVLLEAGKVAPGKRSAMVESPSYEALREGAVDEAHLGLLHALSVRALVVVPLVANEHHLGTVAFARLRGARPFGDSDIVALEDLARRAAIALDNARLYAAAQDANRAKDQFLATVSHELRSPLNAILGWAQMLVNGLPADKHAKAMSAIVRNARAQAALIDDLLDMSRIVSGTMRLELAELELGPLVDAVVESLRPQLEAKQIVLRVARAGGPHRVMGDHRRLHQILGNLVMNAIKFTPSGGNIEIAVRGDGDGVTVSVTDDGQGIDASFIDHVFERFTQADGSASRAQGGLGLGLAITKHLVELHGGTIRAESQGHRRGARFVVTLRRSELGEGAASVTPESARRPGIEAALAGISILVVDDEPDAREMLVSLLEQFGASTRSASCAADAFDAVAEQAPDVLLSDLGMPDEDGYSLIRRIRQLPRGATLPAIAISGFASTEDRERALRAGFHLHLAKPVKLDDLLSTLTRFRRAS